jgi:hypothetical protein
MNDVASIERDYRRSPLAEVIVEKIFRPMLEWDGARSVPQIQGDEDKYLK